MSGISNYYFILSIFYLGLCVYNGIFYSGYKSDVCTKKEVSEDNTITEVPSSLHLTLIPFIMTLIQAGVLFTLILNLLSLRCFVSMPPE